MFYFCDDLTNYTRPKPQCGAAAGGEFVVIATAQMQDARDTRHAADGTVECLADCAAARGQIDLEQRKSALIAVKKVRDE